MYKEEGTAEGDDGMASEACFGATAGGEATAATAHLNLINNRLTIYLTILAKQVCILIRPINNNCVCVV